MLAADGAAGVAALTAAGLDAVLTFDRVRFGGLLRTLVPIA